MVALLVARRCCSVIGPLTCLHGVEMAANYCRASFRQECNKTMLPYMNRRIFCGELESKTLSIRWETGAESHDKEAIFRILL